MLNCEPKKQKRNQIPNFQPNGKETCQMMTILPHYGTRTMDLDRVYCLLPALQKNHTPTCRSFSLCYGFFQQKKVAFFAVPSKAPRGFGLGKTPMAFVTKMAYSEGFVSFPEHRNGWQNHDCHFDFVPLSNLGLGQSLWQQIPQYSKST